MTWFLTTKLGRSLAMLGAALLFVMGVAATFYRKGAVSQQNKRLKQRMDAIKHKDKVEDEITELDDTSLADRFTRVRDDG